MMPFEVQNDKSTIKNNKIFKIEERGIDSKVNSLKFKIQNLKSL